MSLTSDNLIGYLRAEFHKLGQLRIWLFFVKLAAALPPAISVPISDHERVLLYILAITAVVLLVAWSLLNEFYVGGNATAISAFFCESRRSV